MPTTVEGIQAYLSSGLIQGLGPKLAQRLTEHFGAQTLEVIDKEPERLYEVPGLGPVRVRRILGLPPEAAGRPHPPLREALEEGHVYLPRPELLQRAARLLEVEAAQVEEVLEETAQRPEAPIRREAFETGEDAIYLTPLYRSEVGTAERLRRLLEHPGPDRGPVLSPQNFVKLLGQLEEETGLRYSEEQQRALQQALEHKVLVLTGGPGTGKTSTVRGLIHLFESLELEVALASPTGRAAKRLERARGASTPAWSSCCSSSIICSCSGTCSTRRSHEPRSGWC